MRNTHLANQIVGISMTMGICFGVVLGAVFDRVRMGVAFGMVAGIVIGAALSRSSRDNIDEDDA